MTHIVYCGGCGASGRSDESDPTDICPQCQAIEDDRCKACGTTGEHTCIEDSDTGDTDPKANCDSVAFWQRQMESAQDHNDDAHYDQALRGYNRAVAAMKGDPR